MASDLVVHCFPMSNKKDARLIWVKVHLQTVSAKTENDVLHVSGFYADCY